MGLFSFIKTDKNKDLRKPECPYCKKSLMKIPSRKIKCDYCGNFMFVRTTPKGNNRVLVTENEANKIDIEWAKVNGNYDMVIEKEKTLEKIKLGLKEKRGVSPSDNDVKWSYLNQQLLENIKNNNWGSYGSVKREMAQILEKEGRMLNALHVYLSVCFLEINGASNSSTNDPEILKELPPFNLDFYESLNPWLVNKIRKIMDIEKISLEELQSIFIDSNKSISKYGMPLSVDTCWAELKKALEA